MISIKIKRMKRLKKTLRMCSLILFMLLAAAGIGILGVAPTLTKDRKLFAYVEVRSENNEEKNANSSSKEQLNF
jgi:hypothetical protein